MLVLSRRSGESIIINGQIQIKLLEIDRLSNKIKLGIIADPEIPVVREEIYEASTGFPFQPYSHKPIPE